MNDLSIIIGGVLLTLIVGGLATGYWMERRDRIDAWRMSRELAKKIFSNDPMVTRIVWRGGEVVFLVDDHPLILNKEIRTICEDFEESFTTHNDKIVNIDIVQRLRKLLYEEEG